MPEISEPYKPFDIVKIASLPTEIKIFPQSDTEIVDASQFAFRRNPKDSNFLPEKYQELENWFLKLYNEQFEKRLWIDVAPLPLDYLFQQFSIKMDEKLKRNGANTFGLFAVNYLEGIGTMGKYDGYLGTAGYEHRKKDQYRALLLGCSSITTADDYFRFIRAINPSTIAIVTDINPLATKLSKVARSNYDKNCQVVQSDAQRVPLSDGSVDFIATNYLVQNLVDVMGSGKETIAYLLQEASRVLSKQGRLVMVESLKRIDLEWLNYYASKAGLTLVTGGPEGGILKEAVIFKSSYEFDDMVDQIPEFISFNDAGHRPHDPYFKSQTPFEYFGGQSRPDIQNLIYQKRTY